MERFLRVSLAIGWIALAVACQKGAEDKDTSETSEAAGDGDAGAKASMAEPGKMPPRPQVEPPMDVSAPPADAVKTESGLAYKVLTEGTAEGSPGPNDMVDIHFSIWKTNGETLFSTANRQSPQQVTLAQMQPGWIEMLGQMKIGEKRLVWMPPELAHRPNSRAPDETMAYQIELLKVTKAPPVPEDVAAAPADATKTKTGLAYKVLKPGTGKDKPRAWDQVTLHYTGWTQDGKMFESTEQRNRPQPVPLFRAMPGWSEAIQTMVEGQRNRVWIPADLVKARPGVPEGQPLVYDLEVVKVKQMPKPPEAPKNVAAPPKDAKKTEKGVSYKVLKPGTGKEHPTPEQMVEVHYTGWTTDGEMFDSSVTRGQPARFPLSGVIPGWTDGLQTMVVGEKTRFWIPEELAYKGRPNAPQGMLVFDVELLKITSMPQMPQIPAGALQGHQK